MLYPIEKRIEYTFNRRCNISVSDLEMNTKGICTEI